MSRPIELRNCHPEPANLRDEVIAGLSKTNKELPCKLFYDRRGSELFERICNLEEYYPTRTETQIMETYADEMSEAIGPNCLLIEYGSGNGEKTRVLLGHLDDPVAYVPIDISIDHLLGSSRQIAREHPELEVMPICADYEQAIDIPPSLRPPRANLAFYPGSTIGNFHPPQATRFLKRIADQVDEGGQLLIGVDLKKDPDILTRAYNDSEGVTAEFNLNILLRINDELGSRFDPDCFRHHAYYNEALGRIEMHLLSRTRQTVDVDGVEFQFEEGESIWTESSYKYDVAEFAAMASKAGFGLESKWLDDDDLFSVQLYTMGNRN